MAKKTIKDYIIKYSKKNIYFNLDEIKKYLKENKIKFTHNTLKQNIYLLKKKKILYSAGRGWYSTIEKEFKLDKQPIEDIVQLIHSKYPLLEFSCWSTEQIKGYFHHLPSQFVAFIYSDKDYLSTIKDFLNEKNYNVYLNPHKHEIEKFVELKNKKNIILRPSIIFYSLIENNYAKIEKILIDLFLEIKKINLIDKEECLKMFINVITNYRIDLAKSLAYAYSRKIDDEIKKIIYESVKN
jgi:DNA-binding transcriptional MerR regulator